MNIKQTIRSSHLFVAAILATCLAACAPSPEDAREKLGALGVQFTPDQFVSAARNGDTKAVELFLLAGMDPNVGHRGYRAVDVAAAESRWDLVEILLNAGAIPAKPTDILYDAALGGHEAIVRTLLDAGADPDYGIGDAALGGHEAIVRTLLDAGADPSYAIEDAAQGGHEAIVRTLLDAGAHPNAGIECAPIECAAREGHEAIVRTLLDAGADPNAGIECAPIECAAREGHEAIVRMLQDAIAETR